MHPCWLGSAQMREEQEIRQLAGLGLSVSTSLRYRHSNMGPFAQVESRDTIRPKVGGRMKRLVCSLVMLVSPAIATPQNSKEAISELQRNMPSEKEFADLLAKADQKVSTFEAAVKDAKTRLDKIDAKYAANYLDGAATAHSLLSKTIKNGSTAYAIVGILTTLDDLSLDAATGGAFLLAANQGQTTPEMLTLSAAGTACNDIAQFIFHAT